MHNDDAILSFRVGGGGRSRKRLGERRWLVLGLIVILGVLLGLGRMATAEDGERDQIEEFSRTLMHTGAELEPGARRAAAAALLALGDDRSLEAIRTALRSGQASPVRAAARAMYEAPLPPDALLEDVIAALTPATSETLERLGPLLVRYGEPAMMRLFTIAENSSLASSARLGAIYAIGNFRDRVAAAHLVGLLDANRREPSEIIAATCESLGRLTGRLGVHPAEAWRAWWDEARELSEERWLAELVRGLSERADDSFRQSEQVGRRYVELLREVYRTLPLEQQHARLVTDLGDELAAVRSFALSRIERLRRDQERIPQNVQDRLLTRLDDEVPSIRAAAAALLDELRYEGIEKHVATSLEHELDGAAATAYLAILAKKPTASSLDAVLARLREERTRSAAMEALWRLVVSRMAPEDRLPEIARAVTAANGPAVTAAKARLLAAIGTETQVQGLEPLLDGEDAALRRAVAEGLRFRGRWETLVTRADDEAIYPVVLGAVADQPPSIDVFSRLVELRPSAETHRGVWRETLASKAATLPPTDLLRMDDRLAMTGNGSLELRRGCLSHVRNWDADSAPAQVQLMVLLRLGEILIDLDDGAGALETAELVASLPGLDGMAVMGLGGPSSARLAMLNLRFQALLCLGQFEQAARISSEPDRWVMVLDRLAKRGAESARPLLDEIVSRWGDRLDGEARTRLEAAARLVMGVSVEGT